MSKVPVIEVFHPRDADQRRFVEAVVSACRRTGTIARATFIKKDGSVRRMRFITAQSKGYEAKGSEAARTRDRNNPHLLRLIDLDLYRAAKKEGADKQAAMSKAFRTMNAHTCLELRAHGVVYRMN